MKEKNTSYDTYPLGRNLEETQRLQVQAQVFTPPTQRLLEQAGVRAGMRVLDVGTGAGDVALLLTDMVGPDGAVVGVDSNPTILDTARWRVASSGWSNVTFLEGDIENVPLEGEFDAIVGRFVLNYLHSPVVVLRRLAQHLRPEGIMAFQEPEIARLEMSTAYPPVELWEQSMRWIGEAFRHAGLPTHMGANLYTTFLDAGLPQPHLTCETSIFAGADSPGYDYGAETVRSLLPLILKFGIATAEEVAIETLAERLRAEAVSHRAVVRGLEIVSAWCGIVNVGM